MTKVMKTMLIEERGSEPHGSRWGEVTATDSGKGTWGGLAEMKVS